MACRHILEQVEEAEGVAFGGCRAPRGKLTATATMMLGRRYLIPIATDLLSAYPAIVLHLCLGGHALELRQSTSMSRFGSTLRVTAPSPRAVSAR